MAELHGRVLGFPNREALASAPRRELRAGLGLGLVVALLASAAAHAQAPTPDEEPSTSVPPLTEALESGPAVSVAELERLASELRSDDASVRHHAIARLGSLPASALPSIVERVRYLARLVIPPEDGEEALQRFRHATGSRRADDMIDVAPGIPAVLAEDRSPAVGRTAERVLLIRSLEQLGTLDAWRALADVYALSPEMWRWELRRALTRVGPRLMPALILARGHRDAALRRWARDGVEALRLTSPADAMQTEDLGQLGQLVLAYAEVRDLDAMPVTVGFVDHPDPPLREAARRAMERYGQNGVWQLRTAFRHKLNEEADLAWGWRRTMTELWTRLDQVRLAPQSARIDAAAAALGDGRADEALSELDLVLRETPSPPRADEVASLLASIAASREDPEALRLLRRATWLAPDHSEAAIWRARIALLEAESDRARGVVDLDAYEAAARVPLSDAERARVAAVLEDEDTTARTEAAREESAGFPWSALAFLAALIFSTLVVLPRVVAWSAAQVSQLRRRRHAGRSLGASATAIATASSVGTRAEPEADSHGGPSLVASLTPPSPAGDLVRHESAVSQERPAPSQERPATNADRMLRSLRAVVHRLLQLGRAVADRLLPHARRGLAALRAHLSPPAYGPRPIPQRAPRPRAELDPSLVLGAFTHAAPDDARREESARDEELAQRRSSRHARDEESDDDESFDFDAVVARLGKREALVEAPSRGEENLSDAALGATEEVTLDDIVALADSTLTDVVGPRTEGEPPAHDDPASDDPASDDPASDDPANDDPDAVLAALLLGADPSDTLPGAPAPSP